MANYSVYISIFFRRQSELNHRIMLIKGLYTITKKLRHTVCQNNPKGYKVH